MTVTKDQILAVKDLQTILTNDVAFPLADRRVARGLIDICDLALIGIETLEAAQMREVRIRTLRWAAESLFKHGAHDGELIYNEIQRLEAER